MIRGRPAAVGRLLLVPSRAGELKFLCQAFPQESVRKGK